MSDNTREDGGAELATLSQPIKRHGGKAYLAPWIISNMPPRAKNPNAPASDDDGWVHYVEPYFGGGSVLFAMDPEGIGEVVNDLDCELTNFWCAIQDDECFAQFVRRVQAVPCSKIEFDAAAKEPPLTWDTKGGMLGRAVNFFIRNRQSRQALGKDFATLARSRTRRGMNELPSAWLSAIEGLPEFHARLKRVVILNDDAVTVINQQDGPRTLFYCDPPYLHETRSSTGEYQHEMSVEDHRRLLETLSGIKGRFLLSGYPSSLYDSFADQCGWSRFVREIDNKASSAKEKAKKTEVLWRNF